MSKATITLADVAEGEFSLSTEYEGGYQVNSMAHEAVVMIIKFMDQIAEQRSRVAVNGDVTGELAAAVAGDLPSAANAELQAALTTMRRQADARVAANALLVADEARQVAIASEADEARLAVRAQG